MTRLYAGIAAASLGAAAVMGWGAMTLPTAAAAAGIARDSTGSFGRPQRLVEPSPVRLAAATLETRASAE